MVNEKSWKSVLEKAEHWRAVGVTEHYLSGSDLDAFPWHLVQEGGQAGGYVRHGIATKHRFTGVDPDSGMSFTWTVHLEKKDSNGHIAIQIDLDLFRSVYHRLPVGVRDAYAKSILTAVTKSEQQVSDWMRCCRQLAEENEAIRLILEP